MSAMPTLRAWVTIALVLITAVLPTSPVRDLWQQDISISSQVALSNSLQGSLSQWSRCGGMAPNDLPSGVDSSQLQDAPFPGVSCPSGTQCFRQSEWYWQCLQECPLGWACSLDSEDGYETTPYETAPDESWCSETSSHSGYGLTAEGKCVDCEPSKYNGGNECRFGAPCPGSYSPFTLIATGGYRHCVCSPGWWGRARGYPDHPLSALDDLGCYWCRIPHVQSAVNATVPHDCNTCGPDNEVTGQAPFCEMYSCQGSKTSIAEWNPVNRKCECAFFAAGKYPDCTACPSTQSSYQISPDGTTDCFCSEERGFLNESARNGCRCDLAGGYIPLPKTMRKNVQYCTTCKEIGNKRTKENGTVVCSCDNSAGYGYPLDYSKPGADADFLMLCMACSGGHYQLDTSTGFCKCKLGFGVWANLFRDSYCRRCIGAGYKLDVDGWCVCADGYALDSMAAACIPCNGTGYKAAQGGECSCSTGFVQDSHNGHVTCTQCPGNTTSIENRCVCETTLRDNPPTCGCKAGYKEDASGRCRKTAECASNQLTAQFWNASQLPGNWDGKQFPVGLLNVMPMASRKLQVPANLTTAAQWEAVAPGLGSVRFAARYSGCLCRPDDKPGQGLYIISSNADMLVVTMWVNVTASGQGGGVVRSGEFGDYTNFYSQSSIATCQKVDVMQWSLQPAGNAKLSMFFWY